MKFPELCYRIPRTANGSSRVALHDHRIKGSFAEEGCALGQLR